MPCFRFVCFLGVSLVVSNSVLAQVFLDDGMIDRQNAVYEIDAENKISDIDVLDNDITNQTTEKVNEKDNKFGDSVSQVMQALDKSAAKLNDGAVAKDKNEDIFIPEGELYRLDTPTEDGSVRGGQVFVEVDEKGRMKKVSNIFLYYDEFKISGYVGGSVSCNVRFNLLSNLDQKINRLDVKLVWPGLTTTLSFADVAPNTQTYYNYALLGKGCYNMDKAPNIIVNRCRVRGMTASECADKIVWLSK